MASWGACWRSIPDTVALPHTHSCPKPVTQIRQHLLPRRLKVLVLGSATAVAGGQEAAAGGGSSRSSKVLKASSTAAGGGGAAESVCPPAHELAWGYDVVITTFQRLSSDWSMRSDPRLAERLVLLKVLLLSGCACAFT